MPFKVLNRIIRQRGEKFFLPPRQWQTLAAEREKGLLTELSRQKPSSLCCNMGCITSKSAAVDDSREGVTRELTSSSKRVSEMKFFSSEPLPCDPSSLPKYPPSKEIDTKLQEEATRHGADGGKEQKFGGVRREKESQTFILSKDNARISMQQGQRLPNSRSRNEFFNPHREPVSGHLVFPPKQDLIVWRSKENPVPSRPRETIRVQKSLESTNGSESRRRHDKKRHSQRTDLKQIENGKVSTETLIQNGHGSMGNNIYLSGPLLVSSNNMDQMLKERDRKIQEYSRRARIYKSGEKARAKQN
ncbi:serine/threonine-protein kinase [Spatholobus suberectus]|nr:serine/threonine-protein kinase [Spatholobus suberectus]